MNSYETLTIERRDAVAEITLTRPEVHNRFDDALHVELTDALRVIESDASVRAIVLASTGKVFSAGGDFELMTAAHDDVTARFRIIDDGRKLLAALLDLAQPLVAAVQGPALGLGVTVVGTCDAVVASRNVTLADVHVNIGLVAGDGGCLVWPQSVVMIRARRHLLTGDPLTADAAYELGFVTDLVDTPDEVLPAARTLADRIAALPPLAVQGTKRALNRVAQQRAGEVVDLSFAHEMTTLASDDLLEAVAAFKQKREPKFDGK